MGAYDALRRVLSGLWPRNKAALTDAASNVRRLKGWNPTDADLASILSSDGDMLVKRARHLCLMNPYAANAKESFAASVVGSGIRPSPRLGDEKREQRLMDLWEMFSSECDADGVTNFYGLQAIIAGSQMDGGEVFVRFRRRRLTDDLTLPLQLQVMESEQLDRTYNARVSATTSVQSGIEMDSRGRRLAYHFWNQHPGNTTSQFGLDRIAIPARDILHVVVNGGLHRPGQLRGVPRLTPAMLRLHQLDQYDDAELARKHTSALVSAWVTQDNPEELFTGTPDAEADDEGTVIVNWEPGTIHTLDKGQDIRFSEPADVGGNYEDFQYRNLLAITAALGLPYASVTNDVDRATYSNTRAALMEARRRVTQLQQNFILPQLCQPVWKRFVQHAVVKDASLGDAEELMRRVKWICPRWEWVDPLKDRQAQKLAVEMGVKSRSEAIEEEGADPKQVDQRIAQDKEREEALGLSFEDDDTPVAAIVDDAAPASRRNRRTA